MIYYTTYFTHLKYLSDFHYNLSSMNIGIFVCFVHCRTLLTGNSIWYLIDAQLSPGKRMNKWLNQSINQNQERVNRNLLTLDNEIIPYPLRNNQNSFYVRTQSTLSSFTENAQ